MTKFIIALIVVLALVGSSLLALLRSRRDPMGSPEVLDRARQRNRELDAQDRLDGED